MQAINLIIISSVILIFPIFWSLFFTNDNKNEFQKNGRLPFFDFLKGIAIIAVIFIHCFIFIGKTFPDKTFYIHIVNNLFRFAVPFFFIISGILLTPPTKGKLKKFLYSKNHSPSYSLHFMCGGYSTLSKNWYCRFFS